jgi:YbbR domain-containing protein
MLADALARLLNNWPLKLGALVLALLMWLFVSNTLTETKQSTVSIPITVVGIAENQVAIGLPDTVFVTVSGVDSRVDRLRPENLEALLDLGNANGDFERTIGVQGPRDIAIVDWEPRVVTGVLETVTTKPVPVAVVALGDPEPSVALAMTAIPVQVTARGPTAALAQVTQAVAIVPAAAGDGEIALYAASSDGLPVQDVTVTPESVAVSVVARPVLELGEVAVVLVAPDLPALLQATLDRDRIGIAAPAALLDELITIEATVELTTPIPPPGEYTFPVALSLPPGAAALEQPTATLRFGRSPID